MPVIKPRPPYATAKTETRQWHWFSPDLAKAINETQPDISGAILLFGLSTWMQNRYSWTKVDGKQCCFRSLSELAKDHPYLGSPAKIINRLVKKGFLERFTRKKTLYHIPEHVMELCREKKSRIWFDVDEAAKFGVEGAILLANLHWQLENLSDFYEGQDGKYYFRLSPSALAEHLPMSRWSIARHLEKLKSSDRIMMHPSCPHHYRLKSDDLFEKDECAEVQTGVAEVQSDVAEGDKYEGRDVNIDGNENEKWFLTSPPAAASPSQSGSFSSSLPDGLQRLMHLVAESQTARQNGPVVPTVVSRVHPDETPFDDFSEAKPWHDLPYDVVPDVKRLVEWAEERADDMAINFEFCNLPFTKNDLNTFKRLFWDNPNVSSDQIIQVLETCLLVQKPEEYIHDGLILAAPYGLWNGTDDDQPGSLLFPKRVRSAEYFLKRFPEILAQLNFLQEPDHFSGFDYSYLGKPRVNKLVQLTYNGGVI